MQVAGIVDKLVLDFVWTIGWSLDQRMESGGMDDDLYAWCGVEMIVSIIVILT